MLPLLEHDRDHFLVDRVVLGKKNPQGLSLGGLAVAGRIFHAGGESPAPTLIGELGSITDLRARQRSDWRTGLERIAAMSRVRRGKIQAGDRPPRSGRSGEVFQNSAAVAPGVPAPFRPSRAS